MSDQKLRRAATTASVIIATILVAGKCFAWLASGSVAVLSSLADSGMDLIASAVTFDCQGLSAAIAEFGEFETHDVYVSRLRQEHRRKRGFWGLIMPSGSTPRENGSLL